MVEYIREELALKTIAKNIKIQYNSKMEQEIVLTLSERIKSIDELKDAVDKGKRLNVEIKPYRAKRSNDANAMLWVILGKMAEVLRTDKDSVYMTMLERYGQYIPVIVKPEAVGKLTQEWKIVKEIGRGKIGGKDGVQLLCYFGSHTYDSREFSILLNGVVDEAIAIGVDVISDSEKNLLISEWGNSC